jgi:hypothetical protein
VNGSINTTELNAPAIKLTDKNNLGVVKNVTGATTLTFADGEYINLQSATSYTVTLPLATASSIGARFVFFFSTTPLAGTKTIQRSGTQFIYTTDSGGGIVTSVGMSPTTDFCIELVCIASSGTCWSMTRQGLNTGLVAYLGGPNVFTNLNTFQGGITATASQTINFGTNAPAMSGANITAASIPNSALQSTVALTNTPETITSKYTFTGGIDASAVQVIDFSNNAPIMAGTNISGVVKTTGDQSISGTKTFSTAIKSLKITPTNRPELSNNKYVEATNTLDWEDPQNIIFNKNGNFTTFLPSVLSGGISRVGSRFTFGFTYPWTGNKTVQAQTGQYIYDGGSSPSTNIGLILQPSGQHFIELLCVNYSANAICWAIVGKPYGGTVPIPTTFSGLTTFTGGITANAAQTINFGTNAPTMAGTNVSGVVKTIGNESIAGIKTFSSAPVMSGASITTATINANAVNNLFEDTTLQNYGLGFGTGNYGGGDHNTAMGYLSMSKGALLTGATNSGYGGETLRDLETGSGNSVYGAFGFSALINGSFNSGIGGQCAENLVNGSYNTICGALAASSVISTTFNNCSTLGANTSISNNLNFATAIGANVMATNSNQVRIGRNTDTTLIDGNLQVVTSATVPTKSPNTNTTDVATTEYIYRMLRTDDISNNIFCGLRAGNSLMSGFGFSNVSIGTDSTRYMTTGYENVSIGVQSSLNHNGFRNVAIGVGPLTSQIGYIPTNNVAIGYSALGNAQNCDGNFALGASSLLNCSIGGNNAMMGFLSGAAITTGSYNNGIAYGALNTITTGDRNCGIGVGCGGGILTGSRNTFLGDNTSASGDFSDSTAIGANSVISANNQIVIGTKNENIMIKGCQYIQGTAPVQTGSFTISASLIYQFYPIHITATATCTLPDASADLLGVFIRFRRVGGDARALNSGSSNIRPINSFTANAVLLTASITTSIGNAMQIICLPLNTSPVTYAWHDAA